MRQHRPGEADRPAEVGVELPIDLGVGDFLSGSSLTLPGVGEDDVDAAQLGERPVDCAPHGVAVGNIQSGRPQLVLVAFGEIRQLLGLAGGSGDAVAVTQEVLT